MNVSWKAGWKIANDSTKAVMNQSCLLLINAYFPTLVRGALSSRYFIKYITHFFPFKNSTALGDIMLKNEIKKSCHLFTRQKQLITDSVVLPM